VRQEGMQGCVGMMLQMRTLGSPSPRPSPLGRGRNADRLATRLRCGEKGRLQFPDCWII
jgi:hypothetical protein